MIRLNYLFFIAFLFSSAATAQPHQKGFTDLRSTADSVFHLKISLLQQPLKNFNTQLNGIESDFYRPVLAVSDTQRYNYTYDDKGNLLTDLQEIWINNTWENYIRLTYTYDDDGNQLTYTLEFWYLNSWVNATRETSTYNANGFEIIRLFEYWSNSAWENGIRNTLLYDSTLLVQNLLEEWNDTTWENLMRYSVTYNVYGQPQIMLYEQWINNMWENWTRNIYAYDIYGYVSSILIHTWENNAWANLRRFTSTNNVSGNPETEILEDWDSAWVYNYRKSYTYNGNGNELTELSEKWVNDSWENEYRITNEYENGNLISEFREQWMTGVWSNFWKSELTYDTHGNATRGESFGWINGGWLPDIGVITTYYNNMNDSQIFNCEFVDISYDVFTDISDLSTDQLTYSLSDNYPNPFNPSTTISYSLPEFTEVSIKIFGLLGNEVAVLVNEGKPAGNYKITWQPANLASGVYYYQLRTDSFVETKKMLLIK